MRAIDTNVLVRLIIRDDARQTASAEAYRTTGAWVPLLALTEAIWVLASNYGQHPRAQAETIDMLLKHRDLVLEDAETIAAALDLFRERPRLGFSDCLIFESARKAGHGPLGTFDRALARVAGVHKL
jgi:predicted nucleic-acid-binding protein